MGFSLINIGFGNTAEKPLCEWKIEDLDEMYLSAPVKRMIQDCRDRGELIDATYGRKTRAVLIMDSGQIILSAVQPETVANRLNDRDEDLAGDEELDDDE